VGNIRPPTTLKYSKDSVSRRKKVNGICRICGQQKELSFEHIPPKSAFNDRRYIELKFEDMIGLGPDDIIKGPIHQGGIGKHTLCGKCNNDTGSWYGGRFVDWCYQGMDILRRSGGNPTLIYINYLYPLSIIKQIVTMFFSVNGDTFCKANPELVRFVLDKERKYLSPKYRFFVYYNITGRFRYSGIVGQMQVDEQFASFSKPRVMSEITFPPYGYLMTMDSEPPDTRLIEITHFARHDYAEFREMTMKLPVLPTHTAYPGDYRTKQEILEQAARSTAHDQKIS
jgi:hypothetical protein